MASEELLQPPEYQPDALITEQSLTFNQMFDQMIERFAASGDDSLWMHELPNRNLTKFLEKHGGQTKKEYQSGLPKLVGKPVPDTPTITEAGEWQEYRRCLALAKQFLDKGPFDNTAKKFWGRVTQDQTLFKKEKERVSPIEPRLAKAEFELASSWQNYLQYTRQYTPEQNPEILKGLDILLAKANVAVAKLTENRLSLELTKTSAQQKTELQELLDKAKEYSATAIAKAKELEPKESTKTLIAKSPKHPEPKSSEISEKPSIQPRIEEKTPPHSERFFQNDVRRAVEQYLKENKPAPEAWKSLQEAIQTQRDIHGKNAKVSPLKKAETDINVAQVRPTSSAAFRPSKHLDSNKVHR